MPVEVIGADRVAAQFAKLANISNADFINVISQSTLSLLRNNTPVDTGELQRSWREIYKTDQSVGIGVDPSQVIKLRSILSGTRYVKANDFVTPIADIIFENIGSVMRAHLKRSHPYLSNIQGGSGSIQTPSHTVGLTQLRFMKRRGKGKSYIGRTTLNVPKLYRKISGFKRVV